MANVRVGFSRQIPTRDQRFQSRDKSNGCSWVSLARASHSVIVYIGFVNGSDKSLSEDPKPENSTRHQDQTRKQSQVSESSSSNAGTLDRRSNRSSELVFFLRTIFQGDDLFILDSMDVVNDSVYFSVCFFYYLFDFSFIESQLTMIVVGFFFRRYSSGLGNLGRRNMDFLIIFLLFYKSRMMKLICICSSLIWFDQRLCLCVECYRWDCF